MTATSSHRTSAVPSTADVRTVTASDDENPRPMRKDAARNRALLITAGREVFARRGLEASLDDVAHRAGVGVGTAYRHFGNKFELAEAIMQAAIGDVLDMAHAAAAADDPWAGLVGFLESVLELQAQDRGLREVLMGMRTHSMPEAVHDMLLATVSTLLRRAQDAGAVRPDAAASDLGCVLIMLCQVADLGAPVTPDLWRRYLPTLLAGLRPGGPDLLAPALDDAQFQAASLAMKAGAAPPPAT